MQQEIFIDYMARVRILSPRLRNRPPEYAPTSSRWSRNFSSGFRGDNLAICISQAASTRLCPDTRSRATPSSRSISDDDLPRNSDRGMSLGAMSWRGFLPLAGTIRERFLRTDSRTGHSSLSSVPRIPISFLEDEQDSSFGGKNAGTWAKGHFEATETEARILRDAHFDALRRTLRTMTRPPPAGCEMPLIDEFRTIDFTDVG